MKIEEIIENIEYGRWKAFFYTPPIYSNAKSYIFRETEKRVIARDKSELSEALKEIEELRKDGYIGFGYIEYEAGYLLEEKLESFFSNDDGHPILEFNFAKRDSIVAIPSEEIDHSGLKEILSTKTEPIRDFCLNVDESEYLQGINSVKKYIGEGDTYQVNYTVKGKFEYEGSIVPLFAKLIFGQSAEYTALINDNERLIISLSPELFFKTEEDEITALPMKGTIKRGKEIAEDLCRKDELFASCKNRAENIMIVDLLRNDIGKISRLTSVHVPRKYEIKKYESLWQMISTVKGRLKKVSFDEIINNLFPCGSITGAPKIRTMEIINELEKERRGVYTGTIGLIDRNRMVFNVPIRTLEKGHGESEWELGIGSGVVWDSDAKEEFEETKLKGRFLTNPPEYFELFETMLIDKGKIFLYDYHLDRLRKSADYFLFIFNEEVFSDYLNSIISNIDRAKRYRVKILLDKWGGIRHEIVEFADGEYKGKVKISENRIDSQNKFQYFKTTNRELYSKEFSAKEDEFDEVFFLNEKDELAEGAISNILLKKGGILFTPSLESGILEGCFRSYLVDNEEVVEKKLTIKDLRDCDEIYYINSVRKKVSVKEIWYKDKCIKSCN